MKKEYIFAIVSLLIIIATLSFLQFGSPIILGYDGYYHIKIAELTKDTGLIKEFPWLQDSIQKESFADLHFLYHVSLIPFTFLGKRIGMKLAIIVFSALTFLVFYFVLKKEKIKLAWLWPLILLFSSYPLLLRSLLGKQDMLSIAFFILFIYYLFREKDYFAMALTYVFTLTYSFSFILIIFAFIYFILGIIIKKRAHFKIFLFTIAGYIIGLILNPYFPSNIGNLWIQVFNVGMKSADVSLEWFGLPIGKFLLYNLFLLALVSFIVILFIRNSIRLDFKAIFLFLISGLFLVLGFMSRRFVVFIPLFVVWLFAYIFNQVVQNHSKNKFFRIGAFFVFVIFIINLIFSLNTVIQDVRKFDIPHGIYEASIALSQNTDEGDIIFTDDWPVFAVLFYFNSHNYYLYGLDSNFGYAYNPQLYEKWKKIINNPDENTYSSITGDFNAKYILTIHESEFDTFLENDDRFKKVLKKDKTSVYRVIP